MSAWYCACGVHANSHTSQLALSFRLVPLAACFANHLVPFSVVYDAIHIVSALPITSIVLQLNLHPYSPSWTRIPTLHDRFDLVRVSVIVGAFLGCSTRDACHCSVIHPAPFSIVYGAVSAAFALDNAGCDRLAQLPSSPQISLMHVRFDCMVVSVIVGAFLGVVECCG